MNEGKRVKHSLSNLFYNKWDGKYTKWDNNLLQFSGLDPALPLFTEGNRDARLDRHDAQYVEVIHTCGGYLGFAVPIGHVDFYPNGGSSQPGCGTDYRGII